MAAAILVVVAAVALVLSPPGPPALAEYAPRADERIDEALKAQASRFGTGEGGGVCAEGQECTGGGDGAEGGADGGATTTTVKGQGTIDVTRVRRCVGDPPRQTEDPQSPPCVNYFEGDNGGATTQGVTRDEIRVAVPGYGGRYDLDMYNQLVRHFNQRYEFYGRQLRIIGVKSDGRDQSIAAVAADEEARAFAVLHPMHGQINLGQFQQAASRRGLVNVLGWTTNTPAAAYREMAPYAWNYAPTAEELQVLTADFVCSSLAGRQARFAGPRQRLQQRKFAVLTSSEQGRPLDVSAFEQRVARCHVTDMPVYDITPGQIAICVHACSSNGAGTGNQTTMYADLTSRDITSLVLLTSANRYVQWAGESNDAERYQFEPELIAGGMALYDAESEWMVAGKAHDRAHLFGMFGANKLLPASDTPSYWAHLEATGTSNSKLTSSPQFAAAYHELLLLASGIQMAGPRLTPETFAAGLQRAAFPNPNAGQAPYYQAHVGFGIGDYAMTDGASAVWWNDSAPSYGGGYNFGNLSSERGGWCYVRRGARFGPAITENLEPELFDTNPTNCR